MNAKTRNIYLAFLIGTFGFVIAQNVLLATEGITTATILSTTVSGNSAGGVQSGAFFGGAQVTITDCTISGNSADGGILSGSGTFLTVANSTISDNLSGETGGGILVSGLVRGFSIVNPPNFPPRCRYPHRNLLSYR